MHWVCPFFKGYGSLEQQVHNSLKGNTKTTQIHNINILGEVRPTGCRPSLLPPATRERRSVCRRSYSLGSPLEAIHVRGREQVSSPMSPIVLQWSFPLLSILD
jgi:hypothetical protein